VNWDAWDARPNAGVKATDPAIRPQEGVETLRRILGAGNLMQTVVSTTDLQPRLKQWIDMEPAGAEAAVEDMSANIHARPELSTGFVGARTETEKRIAAIWCDLLGLDEVGIQDNFFTELGGHSLLATQLASRIRESFQVEFPVRLMFESPTITALASAVESTQAAPEGTIEEIPLVASPREGRRLTRIIDESPAEIAVDSNRL
jgi:acyl carrier protein